MSIPTLAQRQERLAKDGPGRASIAYRASRTALGRYAWDLSVASIGAANDHLVALDGLLGVEQKPTWAYFTLMRSAVETACLARWLSEPGITPSRRLGRGVAAQIADLSERAKVERLSDEMPNAAVGQVAGLHKTYAALRYPTLPQVPRITALVEDYALPLGTGELTYRLLSGAAHGKLWSMLPIGTFEAAEVSDPRRSTHVASIEVNLQMVSTFTIVTVRTVAAALEDTEAFGRAKREV